MYRLIILNYNSKLHSMITNYFSALENWFNKKFGWFFTNGSKNHE